MSGIDETRGSESTDDRLTGSAAWAEGGSSSRSLLYPEPEHLTANGRCAFRQEIADYAESLGEELDRLAAWSVLGGGWPEHTADAVRQASHALERRRTHRETGQADDADHSDKSLRGALLLTAASIGLPTIPSALGGVWQVVIYALLGATGIAGLIDTWRGRMTSARHSRGGTAPRGGVASMHPSNAAGYGHPSDK